MEEKGFKVIKGLPDGYAFSKTPEIQTQISSAYEEMWSKIYSHFRFNRSVIEDFYQPFDFASHMTVIDKFVWYDVTPDKPLQAVTGYMDSVSAYQCYLEDHKIAKGSEDDPLVIMTKKFQEVGSPEIDFITPYFCYVLGKK